MKATILVTLIGVVYAIGQMIGVLWPEEFARWLKAFPRSKLWGNLLMGIGSAWFLYLLYQNEVADFAPYKPILLIGFGILGIGTMIFVRDFLAVRGLAIVILLTAYHVLNAIQWLDTSWRLVITCWGYLNIIGAIWITISPWRLRDYIEWHTRSSKHLRIGSAIRLAFAIVVITIGLTAIRSAELASK